MEMSIEEVREIAQTMGILSAHKFFHKEELIRLMQMADGKEPCYGLNLACKGGFCMWQEECLGVRWQTSGASGRYWY